MVESIMRSIAVLRPYWCCLQLLNEQSIDINLTEFIQIQTEKIKK